MSAVLVPAPASRDRCLKFAANLLADHECLTEASRRELLADVDRRIRQGMSAASNLSVTRRQARELAHVDAFYVGHSTLRSIHRDPLGASMDKPLRIHLPACSDDVLVVQSFGIHKASGHVGALLQEVTLLPGDTVNTRLVPGGAVVITEAPRGN